MATPTLIIGIGTSGLYILEHVQRFYYETYKRNKPDHVEYLYIETNKDNQVGVTPLPNEIKRVYLSLGEMESMVNDLKRQRCGDWLPPSNQLVNAGLGAGGIRSCGRLALWGRNSEGDNFRNVVDAINHAYGRISSHTINGAEEAKPTVFITGSLTGGTGSGIFIDMGYLLRHLIKDIKELFALLLIPKIPSTIRGYEVLYANTYGALKDLEHFNEVESVYKEKWPNGVSAEFQVPPFELVQFISQDYYDGSPALSNLSALYKMAGLYLFLNIAGIKEKRMERYVDARAAGHIDKYGTFGLSAIQFPKDQIQEYVACQLSIDLINRWTNPDQYYSNEIKKINKTLIFQQVNKLFDEYLTKAFKTLNSIGGRNLIIEIEREAFKINSKTIRGHPVDYILKMFTSDSNDNFYSLVKNNIQSAIDSLIDDIYDLIVRKLDETESLYFTRHVLDSITLCIDKTIRYWKQLGLSSSSNIWEDVLKKLCDNTQKKTYKIVLEQNAVLKDRLLTIFEIMKMHLLIKGLEEISRSITSGDAIPLRSSVLKNELPKIKTIDSFITLLLQVSGKLETQENIFTFKQRIKSIEQDINDATLPILRIYPSGTFDRETENAKRIYIQKTNSETRTKKEVIDASLWEYLFKSSRSCFFDVVYKDCLNAYRRNIEINNCVPDYDVSKYIIDNPEVGIRIAKRALSPFISINKILAPSSYLPKFIAGGNIGSIQEVIRHFTLNNFNDFSGSNDRMLELADMKNIFIFYDEKGGFNILRDLSYIEQMREVYENPPSEDNITVERWRSERNAYKY